MLQLDQYLFEQINQVWTSPWADQFFPWVTDLHKNIFFQLVAIPSLLLFFIYKFRTKGIAVFFLCLLAIGATDFLSTHLLKHTINRPRPGDQTSIHALVRTSYGGESFPSNHAANMACLAAFVTCLLPSSGILFWFLALLIGYSRIYNGVHFPTDVIGGYVVGAIIGYIFARIAIRLTKTEKGKS